MKNRLNFIDVFSGAGGLSCGLEMAGLRCLLGVDHDKHAINTFAANHKEAETFCGPIQNLTKQELKKLTKNLPVHLVVGGPPCQGFSTVGPGNPNDERNSLFLQFVRVVRETNPYFIIIENVTGLVAKKNEKTLKAIFSQFERLGFHLGVHVLSAQDYGVPERRRRTIIIGSRMNSEPLFPAISHSNPVTVGDVINKLENREGSIHNHDLDQAKVKDRSDFLRLKRVPEGRGIRYEHDELKFLPPKLRLQIDWDELPERRFRQTKFQRLDRKIPGPTILTSRYSYYHPVENRHLTAREAAKIQSFPNDFIFHGPISAQWRQIGNAVPPLLGTALGKTILKMYHHPEINLLKGTKIKKSAKKQVGHFQKVREKAFVYKGQGNLT